jgi:Domain of Unknown Function (DUF928)
MNLAISEGYLSFPRKRESRVAELLRLLWTPAFARVTCYTSAAIAAGWLASAPSVAQNAAAAAAAQNQASSSEPVYKPPSRGVPGGRVGGASRGAPNAAIPLPVIDLLAPDGHAGQTTSATPTLYFFVSQPIIWPTQFTISAATRPSPILEVNIPVPKERGIYSLRTADHHVWLEPGVVYTWSVSVVLDPKARSRDIVASAPLLHTELDPLLAADLRTAPPNRRAGLFAQAGLWYDAVAAAAETAAYDRHAALDSLMTQVDLGEPVRYDRETGGSIRLR